MQVNPAPGLQLENGLVMRFVDLFQTMLVYWDKSDPDSKLFDLYVTAITSTNPTLAELEAACKFFLHHAEEFPKIPEFKKAIWDERKRHQNILAGLPPAKDQQSISQHDFDQARQNRIAFMQGIYKNEGDTPFYRAMLTDTCGHWSKLSFMSQLQTKIPVTHEDVIEGLEVI